MYINIEMETSSIDDCNKKYLDKNFQIDSFNSDGDDFIDFYQFITIDLKA